MANVSRIRGFRPIRHLTGAPYNGQGQAMLCIGANESTALFIGDVVVYGGTAGAAGSVVSGMDVEGMATILHSTVTTTGNGVAGVIVGFAQNATLPTKHNPASTDRVVFVETAWDVVYEVQEDGVGNNIAVTAIGANIAIISGAGSTVTGASAYALDSSDTATTLTYPLRLLGLVKRPDNALGLASTDLGKFEVVFNNGAATSVGVN